MKIISQNQDDKNQGDQFRKSANEKIRKLVKQASTCFLSGNQKQKKPFEPLSMAVQNFDEYGNIWFFVSASNLRNSGLNEDKKVQLLFQGSAFSDFLSLFGKVSISKDKSKIQKVRKALNKTAFEKGIKDSQIKIIKVQPTDGYYWNSRLKKVVALQKDEKSKKDIDERKIKIG
jgi:general stress protein 26